jgi:hypothetical protein
MSLPSLKILYTVEESWIHVSEGTESTWRKGLSFFLFSSQQPAIGRCRCFVLILKQQPSACTLSTMVQKISWFNFRNQLAIFSHVSTDAWLSKSAHREIVSPIGGDGARLGSRPGRQMGSINTTFEVLPCCYSCPSQPLVVPSLHHVSGEVFPASPLIEPFLLGYIFHKYGRSWQGVAVTIHAATANSTAEPTDSLKTWWLKKAE